MTIINKVTKLFKSTALTEEEIQEHIDQQNAAGYYLVTLDNLNGWYRFFWEKQEE